MQPPKELSMHPIRRLLPSALAVVALVAVGLSAPAPAAAKGVLPSTGASGGEGVTGPPSKSSSGARYTTLYSDARGTSLLKIETDGGVIDRERWLQGTWALPAVTISGGAGGLSADGKTLVLVDPTYVARPQETEFMVLAARRLRTRDRVTLDGAYSFDAISPNGRLMYLIEYRDLRDPLDYRVRAYDLAAGEFRPGTVVDPAEPDEQMTGQPVARESSPDGRWAYTLYAGGEEAFIHALDTERATAVCIDLDQFGPQDAYRFGLAVSPETGAITLLRRAPGRDPLATIDPSSFEVGPPPAAPSATAPEAADSGARGSLAWLVIGAGTVLLVGASALLWRGRRPQAADEEQPERLVQARPHRG
jgi:hypothetical protein